MESDRKTNIWGNTYGEELLYLARRLRSLSPIIKVEIQKDSSGGYCVHAKDAFMSIKWQYLNELTEWTCSGLQLKATILNLIENYDEESK